MKRVNVTGPKQAAIVEGPTPVAKEDWVREYGREGLRQQVMGIQHVDEQDRVKELEARVAELESALAQVTLDRLMYQAMVEVAEREHGLDLKKKSKPSHRTGQNAETRSQASAHSRGDLHLVRRQPPSALPASEARAGASARSTGHL